MPGSKQILNTHKDGFLVFKMDDLCVVEIAGADAEDFLHRISTAAIKGLACGRSTQSLFLNKNGRIISDVQVSRIDKDCYFLTGSQVYVNELLGVLDQYHFSEKLEFRVKTELEVYIVIASESRMEFLGKNQQGISAEFRFGLVQARLMFLSNDQSDSVLKELADHAHLSLGDGAVYNYLRIDFLLPESGREVISGETIPLEVNLKNAISFTKGCYPGQEVVARIHNLGHPANVLVKLRVKVDADPTGQDLISEGKSIGTITSSAPAADEDFYNCLGIVKWKFRDPGTEFSLSNADEAKATIIASSVDDRT